MNSTSIIPRTCARRTCRLLTQQHQQLSIRSIPSTSPHSYAQPTISQTSSNPQTQTDPPPQDEVPFSHIQTSLNTSTPTKNPSRLPQDQNQPPPTHLFIGTITRTGTMPQTVQITRPYQIYDPFIQKHYTRPLRLKAHDPNPATYLREGDVVEYGVYTQAEKDTKLAKDVERVKREEERLKKMDKTGKAVRRFQRGEATRKMLKGKKVRGVQFVVRRVVTPFGVGLDERMERLGEQEGIGQESSARGWSG